MALGSADQFYNPIGPFKNALIFILQYNFVFKLRKYREYSQDSLIRPILAVLCVVGIMDIL
jgi:hypothetical protein